MLENEPKGISSHTNTFPIILCSFSKKARCFLFLAKGTSTKIFNYTTVITHELSYDIKTFSYLNLTVFLF